jgi:hypothetical protein
MADAPPTRSLRAWATNRELDGRMTVKLTLGDAAEQRAWAIWLSDRAMENDQPEKPAA